MKPLFALVEQYRALEQFDSDDVAPLDEQALHDTLEGLGGEIELKARNVAAHILNIEAFARAAQDAASLMAARANRVQRRADALRAYLLVNLLAVGREKLETSEFTIAVRSNPPAVEIAEGVKLPEKYLAEQKPPPPRTPDKRAIAQALKAGIEIPGCRLSPSKRLEIFP